MSNRTIAYIILVLIISASCAGINYQAQQKQKTKKDNLQPVLPAPSRVCNEIIFVGDKATETKKDVLDASPIQTSIEEINDLIRFDMMSPQEKEAAGGIDVVRYKAMVKIIQHAEFALKTYNSSEALNMLVIGKHYFPHQAKIIELYPVAISEFIDSTNELVKTDCTMSEHAKKRIHFLNKVAPDSIPKVATIIKKCGLSSDQPQASTSNFLSDLKSKLNLNYCEEEKLLPEKSDLSLRLKLVLEQMNSFPIDKLVFLDLSFLSKIKFRVGALDIDKRELKSNSKYISLKAPVLVGGQKSRATDYRLTDESRLRDAYKALISDKDYTLDLDVLGSTYPVSEQFFNTIKRVRGSSGSGCGFIRANLPITNISPDCNGNYFYKLTLHFKDGTKHEVKGKLFSREGNETGVFWGLMSIENSQAGEGWNPSGQAFFKALTTESQDVESVGIYFPNPLLDSQGNVDSLQKIDQPLYLKFKIDQRLISELSHVEFGLDLERILHATLAHYGISLQ